MNEFNEKGIPVKGELRTCHNCGSTHINKSGMKVTRKGKRQRYQCMNCGITFY